MKLTALLRAVLGANLDAETRQALVRAARDETGLEIDAAIDTLTRALGIVDADGEVDEARINSLLNELDWNREQER